MASVELREAGPRLYCEGYSGYSIILSLVLASEPLEDSPMKDLAEMFRLRRPIDLELQAGAGRELLVHHAAELRLVGVDQTHRAVWRSGFASRTARCALHALFLALGREPGRRPSERRVHQGGKDFRPTLGSRFGFDPVSNATLSPSGGGAMGVVRSREARRQKEPMASGVGKARVQASGAFPPWK